MASEVNTGFLYDKKLDSIAADILRPVGISKGFLIWMGFLIISLMGSMPITFSGKKD
jgi:hypothetical protein